MNKERYIKNKEWFNTHQTALKILKFLYKVLPMIMVIAMPVLIVCKALKGIDHDCFRMIYIPFLVLVEITILRKIFKRQRPYEKYNTEPVINRDGNGDSFPSRHTASAFIISMAAIPVSVPVTILLLIISSIIGLTRILSGVHYISDVIAGAAISVLTGIVFFIIL